MNCIQNSKCRTSPHSDYFQNTVGDRQPPTLREKKLVRNANSQIWRTPALFFSLTEYVICHSDATVAYEEVYVRHARVEAGASSNPGALQSQTLRPPGNEGRLPA